MSQRNTEVNFQQIFTQNWSGCSHSTYKSKPTFFRTNKNVTFMCCTKFFYLNSQFPFKKMNLYQNVCHRQLGRWVSSPGCHWHWRLPPLSPVVSPNSPLRHSDQRRNTEPLQQKDNLSWVKILSHCNRKTELGQNSETLQQKNVLSWVKILICNHNGIYLTQSIEKL